MAPSRVLIHDLLDVGVRSFIVAELDSAVRRDFASIGAEADFQWIDPAGDADMADLFAETDIACVAMDAPDLALLYRCNAFALLSRTPWITTYADGPEILVGPLYRPYETACFNDFDTQEEAARTHRMDHLFYKAALLRDGMTPRPIPRFMAEHAGSLAALATAQALTGNASFLEGSVMRVDFERMEIVRKMVLRMPRCPACVGGRPDYRHPFL